MSETIDTDLFVRLMRLSAETRNDLLEFAGQAPVLTEELLRAAENGTLPSLSAPGASSQTKRTPA